MALDKFFCKVADTKANDKSIEFPSEKEAIEYCKENGINPHGIILMGDKYIIKTKDSGFRTTMDKAIKLCDAGKVIVKYDDALGHMHTFFKNSFEEAKAWIDSGKFPHGVAYNVKIDGKLYKKVAR